MRIRSSFAVVTILLSLLALGSSQALAANIEFFCQQESKEILLGESVVEFPQPIRATVGSDSVDIQVEAVLPPGWFWQICQVSTGVCYFQDVRVNIDDSFFGDTLRVDLFPDTKNPGVGYLKVTITNVRDPLEKEYCTYTVFNGVPEADASFEIPCEDTTESAESGTTLAEFFAPLTNTADFDDDIQIRLNTVYPEGWFGQFCQVSTGICYFGDATITVPAGFTDTLRVDFFPTIDGYGQIDLELFSESNPSFWRRCYYRLDVGATTNVPEVMTPETTSPSWAQPNPFSQGTDLRFRLQEAGTAQLTIYTSEGRVVREFSGIDAVAGETVISWDGRNGAGAPVPSGVYFYMMRTPTEVAKGIMVNAR